MQKRACNVYIFRLSFHFACHRWWLGRYFRVPLYSSSSSSHFSPLRCSQSSSQGEREKDPPPLPLIRGGNSPFPLLSSPFFRQSIFASSSHQKKKSLFLFLCHSIHLGGRRKRKRRRRKRRRKKILPLGCTRQGEGREEGEKGRKKSRRNPGTARVFYGTAELPYLALQTYKKVVAMLPPNST